MDRHTFESIMLITLTSAWLQLRKDHSNQREVLESHKTLGVLWMALDGHEHTNRLNICIQRCTRLQRLLLHQTKLGIPWSLACLHYELVARYPILTSTTTFNDKALQWPYIQSGPTNTILLSGSWFWTDAFLEWWYLDQWNWGAWWDVELSMQN